jgi:hypothetical protein
MELRNRNLPEASGLQEVFLRFQRIPCVDPRLKTPFDGRHMLEAIGQQNLRRTGAAFLGGSGAVGDDPLRLVEFVQAAFQFAQRNG